MSHIVLYYHVIWRTKCSKRTITEASTHELYAYILGFCKQWQCKLIRIGGSDDHVHMLVSLRPDICLSDFMRDMKSMVSKWMKSRTDLFPCFDGWGNGYAAFTYSERDKEMIRQYIAKQKEHHKHVTFREEYETFLKEWNIEPSTDMFLKD